MPAVSISPQPKLQFFDANGNPLSGGKLYSYDAGTTTPRATYTDSTGNAANTNPVILDSRGEASVWMDSGAYKLALYTSANVLVWTVDNVGGTVSLAQLAASGGSALIGFLQSGTSAQPRTVQSKLRDVVSVKDFGAVGNGVANDTTAILNALASLSSGGALYFPAGTYVFRRGDGSAQPDTIPVSNVLIYGDGAASKISGFNAAGAISNDVGGQQYNIFQATNKSGITIKDMAFEGYLTPVVLYTCTNVLVDNIYDNGQLANAGKFMRDKSVYVNKGGDIRVVNSRFENAFFGVYVIGDAVTQASRVIVNACSFEHTTPAGQYDASFPVGVYWVYSDSCVVNGCTFKNIYSSVDGGNTGTGMGYGVYEGDGLSTSGTITGNTFIFEAKGSKNAFAIYINEMLECAISGNSFYIPAGGRTPEVIRIDSKNQSSKISITGNTFEVLTSAVTVYCIAINDNTGGTSTFAPRITIAGNTINGGANAIRQDFLGNAKMTISGNTCTGQSEAGIQMIGSSVVPIKHPLITGNTITGSGKNAILFSVCVSPSVIGNILLDGNTTNQASDLGAAILFSGSSGSYIASNTIGNTAYGGGLFTWGVQNTDNAANRIFKDLAFGNSFLGLTLGEGAQFGRYFTSSPTNGIFDLFYNDFVQNASIAAAGNPGWYAVKKVQQSLIANASSASTTVSVTSTTGMAANDIVLLVKDSNPYNGDWNDATMWHVDTVASVTNGTDFVLTTGIPAGDGTYTSGVAVCHFARFKAAAAIAA
jgi:hypothetical protein